MNPSAAEAALAMVGIDKRFPGVHALKAELWPPDPER